MNLLYRWWLAVGVWALGITVALHLYGAQGTFAQIMPVALPFGLVCGTIVSWPYIERIERYLSE